MARKALSDSANEYRQAMWISGVVGIAALIVAWLGARGSLPRMASVVGIGVSAAAISLTAWFGIRTRGQALKDQEIAARRSLIVMLTAQLGHQDDETLGKVAKKGGAAGEAARLILKGRAEKGREDVRT